MHIPRTGGTALGRWLRGLFGGGRYVDLKAFNLPGVTTTALSGFSCFHSWHMGRGIYDWLARSDLSCITLLRQPVERAVSDLHGTQRMAIRNADRFTAARLTELQPFLHASVDDCIRSHTMDDLISNTQSRILGSSLTYARLRNLPAGAPRPPLNGISWLDFPWIADDSDCTIAEASVRAHTWLDEMAVVGLTERHNESMQLIADLLGVAMPKESPRANVNPQRTAPTMRYRDQLAPDVVARLEELNRYDLELYAHATELFEQQWTRYQAQPRRTYSIAPWLRQLLRPLKAPLQRVVAPLRRAPTMRQYMRWFGRRQGLRIYWATLFGPDGEVQIQTSRAMAPLHLRLRTSDFRIYGQVMVREEYALPLCRQPQVIVDAGANIGLTAIYFANRFPTARILAIEPEAANFELLRKNVAAYRQIVPIRAALWDTAATLELFGDSGLFGAVRAQARGQPKISPALGQVDTVTMSQLIRDYHLDFIDLFKVDIEGAERAVFAAADPWIEQVGVIIAEMHDRFEPGCTLSFNAVTRGFPTEWRTGEHVVVARREFV
jgi:FkbM family methyltransferase